MTRKVAPFARTVFSAFVGALPFSAPAATYDFTAASGAWEDPANWSPASLPGPDDFARISDYGGALLSTAQTVGAVTVSNISSLEIGAGGSLTAAHAIVFGSLLGNRSLLLSGGSLSVQGTSPGIFAVYGRMDAIAGSSIDARRMELGSSDLDLRLSDSTLEVDHLYVDALTALNLPAGKLQFTDSTVTTRESEFYYGVVDLSGSTWTSTGNMALGTAPLTLSANSTMNVSALRLVSGSLVTVKINSGSRLQIDALLTGALQGGSFTLTDGTLATGGNIVNHLSIYVAGSSTIDSGAGVLTQMAPISGTTLTKTGSGFLNLGANANPLDTVRVAEGVMQVGSGAVLTPGAMILGPEAGQHGTFRLSAGGTLRMSGLDTLAVGNGTGTLEMNGGILDVTGPFRTSVPITVSAVSLIDTQGTTATLEGTLSGPGELQKTGAGTLFLTGNNTHAGGTTMYAGTIEFSAGGLGPGRVRPLGGTLRWAAGNTEDLSARLEIGSAGATLDVQTNDVTFASAFTTAGNVTKAGAGTLSLTGNATTAALRIAAGAVHVGSNSTVTVAELVLGSTADAPGHFHLGSGGALNVGGMDGIRLGPGGGAFALAGGLLKVTNANLTTSVDLTLSGSSQIDTSGITATLSGVLSGNGSLSKTGAGTLRLTGNNTFTGGTTHYAGDLQVDGVIGDVNVQGGARLTGSGHAGAVTLESGALLAPGDGGAGTISFASLAWRAGATLQFDLGLDGTDFLAVAGSLERRGIGTYSFSFVDRGWQAGATYALLSFGSTDLTMGDFRFSNAGGLAGDFAMEDGQLSFTVTAVPEPAAGAALVVILLAGLALRRRADRRRLAL